MSILLGILFAATAPGETVMSDWARCVTDYARPLMAAQTVDQLADGGMAACVAQENAARQSYVRDLGKEKGNAVFVGVRVNVRRILIARFTEAKQSLTGN